MSFPSAAVVGIEQAFKQLLALDPLSRDKLAALHGQRIALDLKDWNITLVFVPDANGDVQIFSGSADEADAFIRATPFDLAETALVERKEDQVFKGKVELGGDTHVAQSFSTILSKLNPDWEELLSTVTGDVVAHQAGRVVRGMIDWMQRNRRIMRQNIGEYVTEEQRLTPTEFEYSEWSVLVDQTREDIDRLEARVQRLIRNRSSKNTGNSQ
jgi:ubiquinone biosynthesis protein UbiJ